MKEFPHLHRITWKPLNWYPESPDQYLDGIPRPKPESVLVEIAPGHHVCVDGLQFGDAITVSEARLNPTGGISMDSPPTLSIDSESIPHFVDALLYVHRRTHEYDYEDSPQHEDLDAVN
jgi:hypothetical protein